MSDDLKDRRAKLSAARKALLERRLRGDSGSGEAEKSSASSLPKLSPAPAELHEPFALLDMQRAHWSGRGVDQVLGNVAAHVYLESERTDLDLERLASSFRTLIERHEMLRAVVLPDGRQQILAEVPDYEIEVLDLRQRDPAAQEEELQAIRERMSHQVRPADKWPLFEIRASRLDEERTRLHVSFDLLALDVPSLELLVLGWSKLYADPRQEWTPPGFSFRDYAVTMQAYAQTDLYQRSLAYWEERLRELPPAPELPLAKTPAEVRVPRFVRHASRLEKADWEQIKTLGTPHGITPSAILLAVFGEILGRWSESRRFTIGSTLFIRIPFAPNVMDVLGPYTSMSLLEVDLREEPPLLELSQKIQQQLWKDLEHGAVNAVALQQKALASANEGRQEAALAAPVIFTSALAHFEEAGDVPPSTWLGEPVYAVSQAPQTFMEHLALENAGALEFHWDVLEELFPAGRAEEMFEAYCQRLKQLTRNASWHEPARAENPES